MRPKEKKEKKKQEKTHSDVVETIRRLPSIYPQITIRDIKKRTSMKKRELISLLENMIHNGELPAKILGNTVIFTGEATGISPTTSQNQYHEINTFPTTSSSENELVFKIIGGVFLAIGITIIGTMFFSPIFLILGAGLTFVGIVLLVFGFKK